ncbi:MAG TPA: hypothetical protein HPQ03_02025 [Deltaproteobacteria bacterium]|nr:hypothetical protein [Deltaproteobacteria bacterium]
MKRWFFWMVAIALVVGFGMQSQVLAEPRIAVKQMANLSKTETISIFGSGFAPGKEVKILYTDPEGVTADLESSLDPTPSVKNDGTFYAVWKCGQYVSKKMVRPGVTYIKVVDEDYNLLAHGSIAFFKDGAPMKSPVVAATPMVKMGKKAEVYIAGSGFEPGQDLAIIYTDPHGATADLGASLKPAPKADSKGEFATVWSADLYISKKLIQPGVATFKVTDSEYSVLSHGSVAFTK